MPVDRGFCEHVLERLEPFGQVTGRAMFGGFGIWERGDMFALVDRESNLYFKIDDASRSRYEAAGESQFWPPMPAGRPAMAMPYFTVPADVFEDPARLEEWAREAIAVAHATAKRKPAKKAAASKVAAKKTAAKKAAAKKAAAKKAAAKKAAAAKGQRAAKRR